MFKRICVASAWDGETRVFIIVNLKFILEWMQTERKTFQGSFAFSAAMLTLRSAILQQNIFVLVLAFQFGILGRL